MSILVMGLGNDLLADEGVGVHAARALAAKNPNDHVTILEVGTALLDALPLLEKADRVIVLDAVKAGGPPGSIYFMPYEDFERKRAIPSMHGFDLWRVLALAGREVPPEVTVLGVEPKVIDWSLELSGEVRKSLPILIEQAEKEIAGERSHHPVRLKMPCYCSPASPTGRCRIF